ncbi:hypothetical protein [Actibacterium ureilyticum]|uniref:hypothetical protein n=1 Tax=Actibacterium ureilyticum TaxID=1590614 RepID=UPI000BAB1A45|nr:hypothetical protein [Actibacterium ureilyticum]
MRKLAAILIVAMALGAGRPAVAGQPIHESLMDCAALYTMGARMGSGGDGPKARALGHAAEQMTAAAILLARRDGIPAPEGHILTLAQEKVGHWDAKGRLFVLSRDFRDWAQYCGKLSDALGLDLRR